MNQLAVRSGNPIATPTLVSAAGDRAQLRFLEFFAANIRNADTRRAYARAVTDFLAWCEGRGVTSIMGIQPLHVGAYIEVLSQARSAPTAKQHLAAIRHLFDWLVMGQVLPLNPASSVRGPPTACAGARLQCSRRQRRASSLTPSTSPHPPACAIGR